MTINNCKKIKLKKIIDSDDGTLSIAEEKNQIPFDIKRVYYIYDLKNKNTTRGYHSHKNLEQVIFCINGYFKLLLDDGRNKKEIKLYNPNEGLYMPKNIWHTMSDFSHNCILLVFASDYFDEDDYIRDYDEFINYIKLNNK